MERRFRLNERMRARARMLRHIRDLPGCTRKDLELVGYRHSLVRLWVAAGHVYIRHAKYFITPRGDTWLASMEMEDKKCSF